MPFGKYKGTLVIDLPGPYLVWFNKKGFPEGEIGKLLALAYELDLYDLKSLCDPLRA